MRHKIFMDVNKGCQPQNVYCEFGDMATDIERYTLESGDQVVYLVVSSAYDLHQFLKWFYQDTRKCLVYTITDIMEVDPLTY